MRITSIAILSLAALSAVFADSRPETTTYVDGNLAGVSPNSGGTLMFSDDKAMYLHTGLETIAIPYDGISNAELGAVKETSHDVPLYKVWARHRHPKTATQYLIVNFKNEAGEDKSMTLELATAAASSVLSDLEARTGKKFEPAQTQPPEFKTERAAASHSPAMSAKPATVGSANDWWGDSLWKTSRNADKWGKPAGANTPEQQR
jgi:hypothetical protein